MKTLRNPADVHAPLAPYTHQIELTGSETLLLLSGQVGMRKDGSVPDDPVEQLQVALENVVANLRAANMAVQDIVKLTLYLVGEVDPQRRRDVAASVLAGHRPCMTLIYAAGLASPEYKVEVDAWASRSA
jgi:2-iminobutanoate/2-iminopropanoate deaminase